jgi:hypothetical protein
VTSPDQITDAMVQTYRRAHQEGMFPGYHGDDLIRAGLAAVISTIQLESAESVPVWDGSDECYHELGTMEPVAPHHLDTWYRALELAVREFPCDPSESIVERAKVWLKILLSPPVVDGD